MFLKKPIKPFYSVSLGKENYPLSVLSKSKYTAPTERQNFTFYITSLYNLNFKNLLKTI